MREPFWGEHPFLIRHDAGRLAEAFFDRHADIDYVTATFRDDKSGAATLAGQRDPEMRRPEGLPPEVRWLPRIGRRPSGRPFEEMAGHAELARALLRVLEDLPYDPAAARWRPECWFGRNSVSLKTPFAQGSIAIYAEGRPKTLPEIPYWIARTSVVFDRHDAPFVEVAADGGNVPHLFGRFLAQPESRFLRPGVRPIERDMFVDRMIDLPLDAFIRERQP